jgi:hypothetical protein
MGGATPGVLDFPTPLKSAKVRRGRYTRGAVRQWGATRGGLHAICGPTMLGLFAVSFRTGAGVPIGAMAPSAVDGSAETAGK